MYVCTCEYMYAYMVKLVFKNTQILTKKIIQFKLNMS